MLRNVPIRTKLIATLLGPLLVLSVLALVGIRSNQAESDRAARINASARLAAGLAPLIHELQTERSLSVSYIDSGRRQWGADLAEQRKAVEEFRAARNADVSGPFMPLLRSPEVMNRARAMGDYLRGRGAARLAPPSGRFASTRAMIRSRISRSEGYGESTTFLRGRGM